MLDELEDMAVVPMQRNRMRETNGKNPSPDRRAAAYTAEQRAQLSQGLRILARMIVRAHLRGEIPRAASPSQPPESEGKQQ